MNDKDIPMIVREAAKSIIKNFNPVCIGIDRLESILIKDKSSGIELWMDIGIDEKHHDIMCDWNQYIFNVLDDDDLLRKEVQEDSSVFDLASSVSIEYLKNKKVIYQDVNGNWFYNYIQFIEL